MPGNSRKQASGGKASAPSGQSASSPQKLRFTEGEGVEADTLLAAIVDSSDDAIISKNLDAVITSWNQSAERIFGYSAQEAIGQRIYMLIPPELADEEFHILERIRRGERIEHYETVRITKAGKRFHVSLTVSPIKDQTGRIVGASKIARDITERKQFQEQLREERERLEARGRIQVAALAVLESLQ